MQAYELIPGLALEADEPLLYRHRVTAAPTTADGSSLTTDITPGREQARFDGEEAAATFTDDKRSKEYAADD